MDCHLSGTPPGHATDALQHRLEHGVGRGRVEVPGGFVEKQHGRSASTPRRSWRKRWVICRSVACGAPTRRFTRSEVGNSVGCSGLQVSRALTSPGEQARASVPSMLRLPAVRSRKRSKVRTTSASCPSRSVRPARPAGRGRAPGPGRGARGPDGSGRPRPPRAGRWWRSEPAQGRVRAREPGGAWGGLAAEALGQIVRGQVGQGRCSGSGTGRGREPRSARRARDARLTRRRPTASGRPWNRATTPPRARKTRTPSSTGPIRPSAPQSG